MINTRNYGDIESVKSDVRAVHDILARQGYSLVLDCIAEYIGITAAKLDLSFDESINLIDSLTAELESQTLERI